MHDTLEYFEQDPIHRKYHHDQLTFSLCTRSSRTSCCRCRTTRSCYGKGSLIGKMPGDDWQQFANLRLLYGYMWAHPGQEAAVHGRRIRPAAGVASRREPRLARCSISRSTRASALGRRSQRALSRRARSARARFRAGGFDWIDCHDADDSVLAFLRRLERRRAVAGGVQLHAGAARLTIASACPQAGSGAKCSTATPRFTAAAASATWAASSPRRCPRTARATPSASRLPPLGARCSSPQRRGARR